MDYSSTSPKQHPKRTLDRVDRPISHNLKKTLVEVKCLLRLCSSIPSFPKDWIKSERPDWYFQNIGMEMITKWPYEYREIYDYKSPIGKTLAMIRTTTYKSPFCATFCTPDNSSYKYYPNVGCLLNDNNEPLYDSSNPMYSTYYDNSICVDVTSDIRDLGSHVLDYKGYAIEALEEKLNCLNKKGFTAYDRNLLCITCPLWSDLRDQYVLDLSKSLKNYQDSTSYPIQFDIVYLSLDNGVLVFSMKEGDCIMYAPYSNGSVDANKINDLLLSNTAFSLKDVILQ